MQTPRMQAQGSIHKVCSTTQAYLSLSMRKLGQIAGTSKTTVARIMRWLQPLATKFRWSKNSPEMLLNADLNLPVKLLIENGKLDMDSIWFSGEHHFHLNGWVNHQNYRIWGKEPLKLVHEVPMHSSRVTMCAVVCAGCIMGPYFSEQTASALSYNQLLMDRFLPDAYGGKTCEGFWFILDSVPPYRTVDTFDILQRHFKDKVIALDYQRAWVWNGFYVFSNQASFSTRCSCIANNLSKQGCGYICPLHSMDSSSWSRLTIPTSMHIGGMSHPFSNAFSSSSQLVS